VLLTDAELDHTLGLLLLREAGDLEVHATAAGSRDTLHRHITAPDARRLRSRRVADRFSTGTEVSLADGLSYRPLTSPRISGRVRDRGGGRGCRGGGTESPTGTPAGSWCTYRAHMS
jgi:pyrroloquinoline quinone biosynthesis protein B